MDIIKQAERVVERYASKKPEGIYVTEDDWLLAEPRTRELLVKVKQFKKPLEGAYEEAVVLRNFERALLLYQRLFGDPLLFSIDPFITPKQECRENEAEYIANAKRWIEEVEYLLSVA